MPQITIRPKRAWFGYRALVLFALFALAGAGCTLTVQAPATSVDPSRTQCLSPSAVTAKTGEFSAQDTRAVAQNIVNCLNAGHYRDAVRQATPELMQAEFGFSDPEIADQALAGFPPFVLHSIDNAQQQDSGRYSVDLLYRREVGAHMLVHERWFFMEEDGQLLLTALAPLPVEIEDDYIEVDVRMIDYAFELNRTSFPANSSIVFHVTNAGNYPHEFVVFRLPDDADMEAVQEGKLPQDLQFVGTTSAAEGEIATDLVLVDLDPGHYAVICFNDEPEGVPHLARGMVSEFDIEATNEQAK